ncbi:DUF4365 domain-containing protein [Saccharopolyspora sp. NPDC002686]|uniref:DUF4365 domain-containing protein n=1 Tax=Saccharopolyspora sp. NPDC002686 TaxID=3154541 RepID=UPI003317EFA2
MERARLPEDACKEHFSVAYIQALASLAGVAVEVRKVDYFGVDLELVDGPFRVDVQMKGMKQRDPDKIISYDLPVHSYNQLADPERTVPGYLFVVEMPAKWEDWARQTDSELVLRKSGYYAKISGLKQSGNSSSQVVHVNRSNRVTPEFLVTALRKSRRGEV